MRRLLTMCAISLVAVAATPAMGGWVVTSVQDLPEYLVAGAPTTITFAIRQHGATLMRGRAPTVRVRAVEASFFNRGDRFRTTSAEPARPGSYSAIITARDTGLVEITIDADFNGQQTVLLPMRVVAPGARPAALAAAERGQHLFIGKGCYTCHVKEDDPEVYVRNRAHVGPDLTGRRFPIEYLTLKLSDPAAGRTARYGDVVMPDLELSPQEIAALTSYINGTTTARR